MTAAKPASQLGRSNLSKGKRWMYDVAGWLREHGFPGADVLSENGRADIAGLMDWTVECKNTQDDGTGQGSKLGAAMGQVLRDQAERGTRWHVVLKKRWGRGTGDGYAVMTVAQWAEIARRLDELEA